MNTSLSSAQMFLRSAASSLDVLRRNLEGLEVEKLTPDERTAFYLTVADYSRAQALADAALTKVEDTLIETKTAQAMSHNRIVLEKIKSL